MQIEIINYDEDSNGGASITLELDEDGKQFLIERGFNSILEKAVIISTWKHYCNRQNDIMSFEKGVECDWCGLSEDIAKSNENQIKKLRQYEEWRKDES